MNNDAKLLLNMKPYFQYKKLFKKNHCYYLIYCVNKGCYPNNYCIIPENSIIEKCGYFISAVDYGFGDNHNVIHTFKANINGIKTIIKKELHYEGTTRFFEALDITNLQELIFYSYHYKNIYYFIKMIFSNNDICKIIEEFLF